MGVRLLTIDDFEDGDIQGWSGDTSNFTAQTNTVLEGTYSGELNNPTDDPYAVNSPEIGGERGHLNFQIRLDHGGYNGRYRVYIYDTQGNYDYLNFESNDGAIGFTGTNTGGTWVADTTYTFELQFDFDANEVTIIQDGTTLDTVAINVTDIDYVRPYVNLSGENLPLWIDAIDVEAAPTQVTNFAASYDATNDEIALSWTDTTGEDAYKIYRSTSPINDLDNHTPYDSVPADQTTYTDTGVLDGERYYYRVVATNDIGAGGASSEDSAETALPAPSIPSTSNVDASSVDASWTASHDNGVTRVEYRATSASTWTTGPVVNFDVESATITGLNNGEEYEVRAVAATEHAESPSEASSPWVTTLPDEDQPTLGNGVEDEIAVDRESATTNYGSVRIQTRETGASSWDASAAGWNEQVLAFDTLETIVTNREDGEEYEVRARTETEHATGAWTEPVAIVAKFPGAVNPSVTSVSTTSVSVDGTDQADNEDGIDLEREERINGEWRDRRTVVSLGPQSGTGAIAATDDTASPSQEYRYRWRAYTEHTSAASAWVETSTPSLTGVVQTRTGASGWQVRVEHANGEIHRPRTAGTPSYQPTVNGLPQVRVPVPRDDKWHSPGFDLADARVWWDGHRLPVDELVDVDDESDHMVLVFEPSVLQGRVQRDVTEQDAHAVAEDIITTDAGLLASVDDPAADTRSDVEMQTADSQTGFQQVLETYPFSSDDPRTITETGLLSTHPALQLVQASSMDAGSLGGGTVLSGPGSTYVAGEAVRFDGINEARSTSIQLHHDHSAGATAAFRIRYDNAERTQAFSLLVDGTEVESYQAGANPIQLPGESPPYWFLVDVGDLDSGEHTLRMEMGETYDGPDQAVLVDSDGSYQPSERSDLSGHPVGTASGTVSANILDKLVDEGTLTDSNAVYYSAYDDAMTALENGDVDAVFVDEGDAGSYTSSYAATESFVLEPSFSTMVLDCAGFVDDRYVSLSAAGGTVAAGVLQGVAAHPDLVAETQDTGSVEQVIAGSLSSTWTGTSPTQGVAISNDQGESWISQTDSESVSGEFASGSAQIRARFSLSAFDSGAGPVEFDAPTSVDAFELSASLDDTPLLVNKSYDGSARSVLNEIADYGNFVWQLWWNPDVDGYQVDWTQPGQRTSELDPTISDYSTSKRTGEMRYGTVVVEGSNRPVSGEHFTASAGAAVDLYQDGLLEGSEAVRDASDGTQYESGSDYRMDYSSGTITVLASGDMTDGEEYAIDYEYGTQGSYTSPSADGDAEELVRDFPSATDDRECGQIALNIVKEIQDPVWEVELEIDELEPGQLLVDEIAWPIPTGGRTVEVRSVDSGPGSVSVMGRGRGLGEVVSELRSQMEAVSQRS